MNLKKIIGQRIALYRKKHNLTQQQLANELGISLGTVKKYEEGQRIPRDEIKVKLAKRLGTSVQEMFYGGEWE